MDDAGLLDGAARTRQGRSADQAETPRAPANEHGDGRASGGLTPRGYLGP